MVDAESGLGGTHLGHYLTLGLRVKDLDLISNRCPFQIWFINALEILTLAARLRFFYFFFLSLHLWHMEVPRLQVE